MSVCCGSSLGVGASQLIRKSTYDMSREEVTRPAYNVLVCIFLFVNSLYLKKGDQEVWLVN